MPLSCIQQWDNIRGSNLVTTNVKQCDSSLEERVYVFKSSLFVLLRNMNSPMFCPCLSLGYGGFLCPSGRRW